MVRAAEHMGEAGEVGPNGRRRPGPQPPDTSATVYGTIDTSPVNP